jgi:hypothetical protein
LRWHLLAKAPADHGTDGAAHLIGELQPTEAWDGLRRIEVPGVLGEPYEIADLGVGSPGAAQRRTGKLGRHPRRQIAPDVRFRRDGFDGRQLREVGNSLGYALGVS